MSADPSRRPLRDSVGMAALVALPVLCCAGPALLAAGALGVLGSWLLNPWLIGTAVLLALGAVAWRLRPRATDAAATDAQCCPPAPDEATPQAPRAGASGAGASGAGASGTGESPHVHTGRKR